MDERPFSREEVLHRLVMAAGVFDLAVNGAGEATEAPGGVSLSDARYHSPLPFRARRAIAIEVRRSPDVRFPVRRGAVARWLSVIAEGERHSPNCSHDALGAMGLDRSELE
jgi:hypothetical protein